jgi:hypothetical protein
MLIFQPKQNNNKSKLDFFLIVGNLTTPLKPAEPIWMIAHVMVCFSKVIDEFLNSYSISEAPWLNCQYCAVREKLCGRSCIPSAGSFLLIFQVSSKIK